MKRAGPYRRFFIETWGCQMNELDSQRMAGQLLAQGFLQARDPGDADVILLNSCSVREKAEQKVYSGLGRYRLLKKDRPHLVLGLCGCVAQQEGERALTRVPDLDLVVGPARVGELSELLLRHAAGERVVATGFPSERRYDFDSIARDGACKGMVTIIEGCDKRCTFCIVPSTRGPERSRPFDDVLAEVGALVARGFAEIELLGQTVNHWRDPGSSRDFADLLDAVARVPGVRRLRFVTSFPRDFSPRMVDQYRRHANLASYLHLPVQSGSDRVLRRMGRGYTVEEYRDLVASVRAARRGIAVTTDVIVGFPGETDEDFAATLSLLEELRFPNVFAFRYSPRPGTAALRLSRDDVAGEVAERRLQALFAIQDGIQLELNSELVGREMEVLITGKGERAGEWTARTGCQRVVHVQAGNRDALALHGGAFGPGAFADVRIERANAHSLVGALATAAPAVADRALYA